METSYLARVIATVWYWHRDRQTNQSNRTVSSETDLLRYVHSIYDTMALSSRGETGLKESLCIKILNLN